MKTTKAKVKTSRRLFTAFFCLAVVATAAAWFGPSLLRAAGERLAFDSGCRGEPELASILMGGINSRPKAAAAWLRQHPATRLVLARSRDEELTLAGLEPNEAALTQQLLAVYGITASRITILPEPQVMNTFEETKRLIQFSQSLTPRITELYILTSWWHSRRAAWTAEHLAKDSGVHICMVPLHQGDSSPNNWWQTDQGMIEVFSEYIKSVRYGIKYGLWSINERGLKLPRLPDSPTPRLNGSFEFAA